MSAVRVLSCTATTSLRISKVQLKAPTGKRTETVPLVAVSVIEEQPPAKVKQLLIWLLLCSEDFRVADGAIRICQWYEDALGYKEEYFRTLKTGSELHKRQFDEADDLMKCMAFDAITAWRVLDLQRLAKYEPDRLASEVVDVVEIQALRKVSLPKKLHPPPGVHDFSNQQLLSSKYAKTICRVFECARTAMRPVALTKYPCIWLIKIVFSAKEMSNE